MNGKIAFHKEKILENDRGRCAMNKKQEKDRAGVRRMKTIRKGWGQVRDE